MAEFLVSMIPIWSDCPWRDKIPDCLEIRRGVVPGFPEPQIIVNTLGCGFHISISDREVSEEDIAHIVKSLSPKKYWKQKKVRSQ